MYPEIFHLSFLHTYGVLVAIAFLAGLWMASLLARRAGLNVDAVANLGIYCALAAIGGAKLMMFLVDMGYYAQHPGEIFSIYTLQAGGVFYGGLVAALGVAWWYMRKTHLPLLKTADVFAPAIALGHGIGRLGCSPRAAAGACRATARGRSPSPIRRPTTWWAFRWDFHSIPLSFTRLSRNSPSLACSTAASPSRAPPVPSSRCT